jgi:hypothetical protein
MEYEFRFLAGGTLKLVHVADLDDDHSAMMRARAYLSAIDGYDAVVVRSGVRFMQKVFAEQEGPAAPQPMLS